MTNSRPERLRCFPLITKTHPVKFNMQFKHMGLGQI